MSNVSLVCVHTNIVHNILNIMKELALYFLGKVTRSEVEVVYNVCVQLCQTCFIKSKVGDVDEKACFLLPCSVSILCI